jgi:hypothetical protein
VAVFCALLIAVCVWRQKEEPGGFDVERTAADHALDNGRGAQ